MDARPRLALLLFIAFALFCLIMAVAHVRAEEKLDVDTALILLADVSESMDYREIALTREAHAAAIHAPEVLSAIETAAIGRIAVAYVEYAGGVWQRVEWSIIDGPQSALVFAGQILAIPTGSQPSTSIAAGLRLAAHLIDTMPYRATRIVVDVMGDGTEVGQTTLPLLAEARAAVLARGAVINGLALMVDPWEANLVENFERHVIGGPGAFLIAVTEIPHVLPAIRTKVAQELY